MFEHKSEKLLPRPQYYRRLARSFVAGLALIFVSLAMGMVGYHFLAGLSWIDSFLDSSMILSGMGPVSPLQSSAAKVFAGCYALYSGIALISTAGIMLAPMVHRSLHRFHLEWDGQD